MLVKSRSIVLHHIKYGDSGILLYCYTEQYGRMAFIANSVRTKNPKFPIHYFQPLTILDTLFYYKSKHNLHRLKELSSPMRYSTIPYQTDKSCIAMFVAEVLYRTLREEESNPMLFGFLINMFQLLDLNHKGIVNFHLLFLLQYSKFLGIFPAGLLEDSFGGREVTDIKMFHNLPADAMLSIKQMLQWPVVHLEEITINNKTRILILDRLIQFYNMHLDNILKLKSLSILREVFI